MKVIDFGIAKAASRSSKTQAGVLKGKFGYMSPEQVRGMPLDRRSDMFAIGTILYEMLTERAAVHGRERFRDAGEGAQRRHSAGVVDEQVGAAELERIIKKALAKDVEDRYQWAAEMQEELQRS